MDTLSLKLNPDLKSSLQIKAIQFGEGNFLRGFIDWMVLKLNEKGLFKGTLAAVQPTNQGRILPKLAAQDGLYTLIMHHMEQGKIIEKTELVNVFSSLINPYDSKGFAVLKSLFCNPDVRYVISNTTEAGITYTKTAYNEEQAAESYPAKLTLMLYLRFKSLGDQGQMTILPCEIVESNATRLKEIVLRHASDWQLPEAFFAYLSSKIKFLNTVVDRTVSGYPAHEALRYEQELGYRDVLMTSSEDYHLLVIEGSPSDLPDLPFAEAGLNVHFCDDLSIYLKAKTNLQTAALAALAPAAVLSSMRTVDELTKRQELNKWLRSMLFTDTIGPLKVDLPEKKILEEYAENLLTRLADPLSNRLVAGILNHLLQKVKRALLPNLLDARSRGLMPLKLCFALAVLLVMYRECAISGGKVKILAQSGMRYEFIEDTEAISLMQQVWASYNKTESGARLTVRAILSIQQIWGRDLSADLDLTAMVAKITHAVVSDGVVLTLRDLLRDE